ncbi:hypothetical protein EDC65_3951 [Stella humosa]|uniref:Apea-like HEPN domain-containing protein n=1 Tax=Stella humosa TaxID=94 RepID=A0A3N1L2A3_9PROT|nr:hypothetical protein [Stella humosa]ROP84596.1 hypothetical protein EDC65_3951 [Stella humosa]BBK34116.1 hypothetical protein STHU_47500 [Stella humosa]
MTYCARYRFKLLSPIQIEKGVPLDLKIPGFSAATVQMGEEVHPIGHWATINIPGFASESEARQAGERLGDALLVVGAVTKFGIDLGMSRSTLQFSDAVCKAVRTETGKSLRSEVHGLMVHEQGAVRIVGMHGRLQGLISLSAFEARLASWACLSSQLTERQRTCAALLNDSFFALQPEGQFVLRVSAVEALCDQAIRDVRYQSAIQELENHLAEQSLDEEVRETLERALGNAKRESLRHAYMTKFRVLRSRAEAKAFDDLYRIRSKFVHDGIGRGRLVEANDAALTLATDLLESELRAQNDLAPRKGP